MSPVPLKVDDSMHNLYGNFMGQPPTPVMPSHLAKACAGDAPGICCCGGPAGLPTTGCPTTLSQLRSMNGIICRLTISKYESEICENIRIQLDPNQIKHEALGGLDG